MDHKNERGYEGISDYKRRFKRKDSQTQDTVLRDKHTSLQIKYNEQSLGRVISRIQKEKQDRKE